jgi:undecaprenyl-diphosphatase
MLSVLFDGMAARLIAASQDFSWKGKLYLAVSAFTTSLLIGSSRNFLGVHFLTDVLGGWAAGVVWLTVFITLVEAAQLSRNKASESA